MTQSKIVKIAISFIPIGPAIYVNIEAMQGAWAPFAIGSVIFAAMLVMLAQEKRSVWFGALASVFISINLATALGNVASISDEARDGRSDKIEHKASIDARRSLLNKSRKAQVDLAGESAPAAIDGEIKSLMASEAPRWRASEHCNPDKITKDGTKTLCDHIAQLEMKRDAAIERERIDAKLSEIDKETIFAAPSTPDPYAERLAQFGELFGFHADTEAKKLLAASRDWGRAVGLELMAAFGPMAIMLFFEMLKKDTAQVKQTEPANALAVAYPRREIVLEPSGITEDVIREVAHEVKTASAADRSLEADKPAPRKISTQRAVAKLKRASSRSITMDDLLSETYASTPRGEYTREEIIEKCKETAARIERQNPGVKLPKEINPAPSRLIAHGAVRATEPGKRPSAGDRIMRYRLHWEDESAEMQTA